jgi:hypothetical protein
MWRAKPTKWSNTVEVIKTEEKGSDVNLITHLVADAFHNRFSVAVVMSNDSDLALAIGWRAARPVGVINPQRGSPTARTGERIHVYKPIREGPLKGSQFSHH